MRKLSTTDERTIAELAEQHGFSRDAVMNMLEALVRGNAGMAQFNHPEFGGSGQWMRGGMTMVSDMFNDALKARVAGLAADLARLVANDGSSASNESRASIVVPPTSADSPEWWPAGLGTPSSRGAQNNARYAYFAEARRLAIEINGRLTIYDTLDHQLGGFSQQQSRGGSLSFHSQHGLVDVGDLPIVSIDQV